MTRLLKLLIAIAKCLAFIALSMLNIWLR